MYTCKLQEFPIYLTAMTWKYQQQDDAATLLMFRLLQHAKKFYEKEL